MAYYAVKEGRERGIFESWADCEKNVRGFSGAKYKKFKTYEEAKDFMQGSSLDGASSSKASKSLPASKQPMEDPSVLGEDEAIAYVDGSFDLSSYRYGYGLVFLTRDGKESFKASGNNKELADMRNVSGELSGAMAAMKLARDRNYKRLYLHYDYQGIESWALGEWKTNKQGTRDYKEFYDSLSSQLELVFIKVKAHAGIKYNEEADELAKASLS